MKFAKGDWVRCQCSHGTCEYRGVIIEFRGDNLFRAYGHAPRNSRWDVMTLERVIPYVPTDAEKLHIVKLITAGELVL